ncbi:myb-binding protein 1A-like protein [Mya arenaria]|uniref:myb-binding protein 1A-like protein n=1 Tax=Mya arenaria TaxID=6604 RepID=UPI0022E83453|nr:myb-binding protein 1A-like protein [Mya arenaria]
MAKHVEKTLKHSDVKSRLPGKDLLKNFTIISEGNDSERLEAIKSILNHLSNRQSVEKQGLNSDVKYAVNRLVQGLSSGRKFARQGFSTALCQTLRVIENVDSQLVLTVIKEKSKPLLAGKPSKAEVSNVYLGQVCGMLALVNSGRLYKDGDGAVGQVVEQLLKLGREKSQLQQLCASGLAQIISKASQNTFKQSILPHLEEDVKSGWKDCSPDRLLLLIYIDKYHNAIVKKKLKEHWGDGHIVVEKNFKQLADIVWRSSSFHPLVHVAVDELLSSVVDRGQDLVKFWTTVARPLLAVNATAPKKILGLHIFEKLLPNLKNEKQISEVLLPDIVSIIAYLKPKKTDDVAKKTVTIVSALVNHITNCENSEVQLAVVKCLTSKPGSCLLDKFTGTNILAKIMTGLQPKAQEIVIEELMKAITLQSNWIMPKESSHIAESLQWCTKELTMFVTNDNTESPLQLKILQLVFLQSFFVVKINNKNIPFCKVQSGELPAGHHKFVMDAFMKTVSRLVSMNKKGVSRMAQLNNHLDVLNGLVQYANQLLSSPEHVQLRTSQHTDEIVSEWQRLVEILQTIDVKRKSEEKMTGSHAFELLFFHTGLQLFVETEAAIESLQDLHVCYKRASKKRKSMAKEDGPAWIEVVTELLLSLMFKGSVLSRNVANVVMSALAQNVTPEALQLIVDALQQTSLDSEDGMVGMEEDDDDDESMDVEGDDDNDNTRVDDDDDGGAGSDSSDSSDDDDDDGESDESDSGVEEEDLSVPEELKKKVKAALGNAAASSDEGEDEEEEEEDVELSDTEMFQLDEVLAAAFRSMKKSGRGDKDRKKQLNTFKSRVLDLVDVLIKHHPTPTVLKTFLLPLVDRVEGGVRKQQEVSLGNRARSTLALMFKVKKLEPDFDVDKDELLDLFGQLLKYASKVSLPALVTDIAKACVLIIRMVSENSGPSPLKTRAKAAQHPKPIGQYVDSVVAMVRAAMLDLFSHKSGHCPPAVFHVLLPRFTVMLWPLTEDLVSVVGSLEIKVYMKTQAASILASMINKQVVHEVNEDDWSKFLKSWKKQFSEVLSGIDTGDVKKMFVQEILAVCAKIHNIRADDMILEEPETEKLDALRSQLNQEGRGHLNKICPRQQHGGCSKKKKKEKKRKQKDAIQENGSHSPGKKSRHENGIPDEDSDELGDEVDAMNVEVNNVQSFGNLEASTPSPSKKKKKKKRSKSQSEGDKSIVNDSLSNEVAMDVDVNDEGDDALTTSVEVKCKLDDATVGENELSKSAKKKKKRKSRAGGDDSMNEMGQVSSDLVSSNENVTEKQNESDIAKMKDDLNASNISTPGKKKHKKNKRKSLDQGHLPS